MRTGFIFLLLSILIIPFLIIAVVMPIVFDYQRPGTQYPEFESPEELNFFLEEYSRTKYPLTHTDEALFVVINAGRITASNIIEFPEGSLADQVDFMNFLQQVSADGGLQIVRHIPGTADLLIISLPSSISDLMTGGRTMMKIVPAVMLLAIILVTTVISLTILQNMNRKFRKLEEAAAEISDGNLDYDLQISGSDYFSSFAQTFNNMRIALKEDKERESRFIMGISHDLKTPLTLIGGYAEALADDMNSSPEEKENYLSIIRRKLNDLEQKINTLIDYRSMQTGEWKTSLEEVALKDCLKETCSVLAEDSEFLKINFHCEINIPGDYVTRMDQGLFGRAIENITGNAFRYTPRGGSINLNSYMRNDMAVIELTDTGCGIDSSDIDKVLEPFYRATKSRREPGFGLGLSIVRSIADVHGWNLKIESEKNLGTKIIISGL